MKKNLFALLLLIGVVLSSCSKETPTVTDARDKFVGTWSGTQRIIIPDLGADISDNVSGPYTKSTSNSNQIIIDGSQTANVNGNSYTYNQFTITENDPTLGTVIFILNGTGTINGSNIIESGTLSTVIQGQTYNGTWTSNLVKQ